MAFDNRKYLNSVAWRTYFVNTTLNTQATDNTPALWDTTIYPIDPNENGAAPIDIGVGYFAISNAGYIYEIMAINVGGNQYRITVSDIFFSQYAPTSGLRGIVYKSAWKGYAFAIAPVWFNYLDNIARDYVNSIEKAILWRNDPNTISIPFTNTKTPSILNYQDDQIINGKLTNLAEDYGENPKVYLHKYNDETSDYTNYTQAKYTHAGGLLQSIVWSFALPISGRILISR